MPALLIVSVHASSLIKVFSSSSLKDLSKVPHFKSAHSRKHQMLCHDAYAMHRGLQQAAGRPSSASIQLGILVQEDELLGRLSPQVAAPGTKQDNDNDGTARPHM